MAKKSLDRSIQKRIRGKAWVRLEISDNARLAFMRGLFLGGDTTIETAHLVETLSKEYGIVAGIDEEVIARILRQVHAEPNRTFSSKGDVIVAQAAPPAQVRDGHVEFLFMTEKLERNPLSYDGLAAAFENADVSSISRAGVRVRATYPGEKLAILHPHQAGKPGQDIFGRIVTPVSARLPKRAHLVSGAFIRQDERDFFSETYGYVCVQGEVLSVVPPVWVNKDRTEVHFVHFPQADPVRLPELSWLNQLLEKMDIAYSLNENELNNLHDFMLERKDRSGHCLLANGVLPIPGEDAYLLVNFGSQDDHVLPDGRVDAVAKCAAYAVEKGQCIAQIIPPKLGTPGKNLKGEEIAAPAGQPCTVQVTENIRVVLEENQPRFFYADVDGNAVFDGKKLDIRRVLRIAGDLDKDIGDIQTDQDVEVLGSVREGLKLTSEGRVFVAGEVEDGAVITAKGDVVVGNGVLGKSARVVTLGNLEVGSIKDSTVVVRKDVRVGDLVENGQVRSGGRLYACSGEEGHRGRIVGGQVLCANGIEVNEVGGDAQYPNTLVGIAPNIESETRMKKLEERIKFCDTNILKIFRTLNIQSLNAQLIEDILRRTPPGRKKAIAELMVKLKELLVYRDESRKGQEVLQKEIESALMKADIQVHKTARTDVQVRIGQHSLTLQKDQTHVAFHYAEEGVKSRALNA